jgi:NitT/TauT family transport system substrate-binding protein
VAFAEINQQVPLFLFAREPADRFDYTSLSTGAFVHTSVMAASPWVALQELLRVKGVDLNTLHLVLGVPPAEARDLFKRGYGGLLELFGLGAAPFLAEPDTHSIAAWNRDIGTLPWSVYYTTRQTLDTVRPQAVAFTRALYRAQQWIHQHKPGSRAGVAAVWCDSCRGWV